MKTLSCGFIFEILEAWGVFLESWLRQKGRNNQQTPAPVENSDGPFRTEGEAISKKAGWTRI